MSEDPILKFKTWWDEVKNNLNLKHPNAVCVSTLDEKGFPSGRFVDLKAVNNGGFIFCTYLDSKKGQELQRNPKISLTFWWEGVGYQVRVTGLAFEISESDAEKYWYSRTRDAQITTLSCQQSQLLSSEQKLRKQVVQVIGTLSDNPIPKPKNWGGYRVEPNTIEFLTFKEDRLHLRELYLEKNGTWQKYLLQP
ncbi:pyridoxine/pyridoxamine 5'-phosphate oxidase [Xenorhabdus doucetiae]|uniref:Pyridoxamine 5'-phosphate oxidase n=1 Tax=Xenorhabdus doucetiae TaxID=351671 RepID=A0A068QQ04_9GAMM|nr:pyridoxal 5'-phosphate synthase [Xenorhabdus doucetiae]TYO95467.1 pyridoxamine 5'-phosphate oxidase [Xenorhabdus doucetiae]CDG16701.1 Pyridoxamine 5'-phosphate oxidase [Xenorhabdus doucetiae]